MRTRLELLSAAVLFPLTAAAQDFVPVNLYVADLSTAGGAIRIGTPVKLTGDRGVSSQPSFTPDGRAILFIGRRDSANAQSDVYRIDLATGAETRITSTPEMENSPTVTPDGKLMVIRWVPATLFTEWGPWIYEMNGTPVKGVLPGPDTVGYYVRVDSVTFAMMRPTSRRSVAIFDARTRSMTDRDSPVATLPPQLIPGQRAISYTRTDSLGRNVIRRFDLATGRTSTVAASVRGRTVHAWTPQGVILMGKGNKVFALNPASDTAWREVASFSDAELRNVTTYAVSPRGDKVILISPVRPPLATILLDSIQAGSSAASALSAFRGSTLPTLVSSWEVSEGGLVALARDQLSRSAPNAVAILEFAAGLYPLSHSVQLQLGLAQRGAGNEAAATGAFRRSLELNAKVTEAEKRDAARAEEALAARSRQ